jgi:hypothetical protein
MNRFRDIWKLKKYVIGLIGMKSDDVLLASFPRSGNTWIRFILCNLLSLSEWSGKEINFEVLNETMPEIGVSNLRKPWAYEHFPRILKTHLPYLPVFRNNEAIVVIRDPKDVMVSYYHYKKYRQKDFYGDFSSFLRDGKYGLPAWVKHYVSWKKHWDLCIKYENLRNQTFDEVQSIMEFLGLEFSDWMIEKAIEVSSLENTRKHEKQLKLGGSKKENFARKGTSGQWQEFFDEEDVIYYSKLMKKNDIKVYKAIT